MQVIDQINGSALFAQSAYSAAVATNDSLGRNISTTYLTAVDLTPYATTAEVDTLSSILSGAIDYVSANAGDEFPASANEAITAYQTNSGNYLTAISIPESATWNDVSTTVQTNSSNWDNVINKLDTTSFSDVSSTFLTAVDLSPYATTNDLEQVSGDITALIPSTAGLASESYVQTNSAVLTGMIDGKQDTLTFGYDEQDKISAINNSAIAGGAAFDVFPISGTGAVNVYEQNSALWISGKDFTSDISYISGTIGDVETLLASL